MCFLFYGVGATQNHKRCFGCMEEKVKEEMCPRCLEVDTFGYSVEYLEGDEWRFFRGEARTIHDFKLYFLRNLYNWS